MCVLTLLYLSDQKYDKHFEIIIKWIIITLENESTMTRLEGELNETMIEQLLQEQTTLYQSQIDNPTVKTEGTVIHHGCCHLH